MGVYIPTLQTRQSSQQDLEAITGKLGDRDSIVGML
jgi:hypothetical protein